MRFDKKEILLKNGDICILRSLKEDDVDKFIEYLKTTSNETHFMQDILKKLIQILMNK